MFKDFSKIKQLYNTNKTKEAAQALEDKPFPLPWNPWLAVAFVVLVYYLSQVLASLAISIYPLLKHWSSEQANAWASNSITAQFIYILLAETITLGAIYLFLLKNRTPLRAIGLRRPRWSDPIDGILAIPVYYILYLATVAIISHFMPSLNVNQQQEIGFNQIHGAAQYIMTFISLVILPPITEEIMVRGFLYGSLKKGMPQIAAALVTSLIFASAHLPEGGSAGPLYIAAIDTFILSLVLIYLREKTNGLYASMTLHACKNGIAFVALFILHVH